MSNGQPWVRNGDYAHSIGVFGPIEPAFTHPNYGHIFDHFAIEYEYPGHVHLTSMCRQIDGCASRVEEALVGTEGRSVTRSGHAVIEGARPWRFEGDNPNPYVQEHRDLIASTSGGPRLNEARAVAESTLTAIMGRMSAYTGQKVTWEQAITHPNYGHIFDHFAIEYE